MRLLPKPARSRSTRSRRLPASLRHGATTLTAEDRFAGSTDVLLSEAGEGQAEALADRLKDVKVAAVYASPMRRTMRTAGILSAPHGLAVDSHGDLYVGEVSWTNWPQTLRDKPRPDKLRSLHKFRKVV